MSMIANSTNAQNERPEEFGRQGTDTPALKNQARQAGAKVADAAQHIGASAKETASSLASEAGDHIQGYVNQQVVAGADLVERISSAIKTAADELARIMREA
jgi:predicted trehalose synthase